MRTRDKALSRLMLIIVVIFIATSALMTGLAYRVVARYANAQIEVVMAADLGGLVEAWHQNGMKGVESAVARRMAGARPRPLYLLVGEDGTKLTGDFDQWPNNLAQEKNWTRFLRGADAYDGMSSRLPDGARILIAHRRADHDAMLAGLRADLIAPALVGLLAAMLVSFFILRKVFDRIEHINATCRAVAGGALDKRVALGDGADEFAELGANVNAMLDRIDILMAATRHLSDQIAHEMRTPLSHLRNRLERQARQMETIPAEALRREAAHALEQGIVDANGVITLFDALLDIAAIESRQGDPAGLVPLDMAGIIRDAAGLYEAVAEERGVALVIDVAPTPILGIEHLMMRVLANLIDNALKFSIEGQSITLRAKIEAGEGMLSIRDEGPGMPETFMEKAAERFSRAPDAKGKPGYGLGLSLVRAICRRHGMTLTFANSQPGLRVTMRWKLPATA